MRIITLQETTYCSDCGRLLSAGTKARYYSQDKIYCEPPCSRPPAPRPAQPPPARQPAMPDPVLLFLQRVNVALRELIDNLVKK